MPDPREALVPQVALAARLDELRAMAERFDEHAKREATEMVRERITELEAEQLRSRVTDPCQVCGTRIQTDTEDDTGWPFEHQVIEGERTVSYVHYPERCVEMRERT